MTPDEEIEGLRNRIDKARADCDVWRAAGPEEKCLEAYFLVEALTLQLDNRLKHLAAGQAAT
jgi:hypothetical protein